MAIFKVTGIGKSFKYHDDNAITNVIEYCRNEKKTQGRIFGYAVEPSIAELAMEVVSKSYYRDSGIRLRHMILSFDESETNDPTVVFKVSKEIAKYYGRRYQIALYVHCNKLPLHTHFVMNTVSYIDGYKYDGSHKDYYDFQNYMKQVLAVFGMNLFVDDSSDFDHKKD